MKKHVDLAWVASVSLLMRKNARFSDIVCLGMRTHKVLKLETISKEDDRCNQRHEMIGVKRLYKYFEDNNIPTMCRAHDNNASVTKYLREEQPYTVNVKDTWHATKGAAADAKKICSGPARLEDLLRTCKTRRKNMAC